MADPRDLTDEERKAIASLKRLAKRWPKTLRLVSLGGSLHVFPADDYMLDAVGGDHTAYDPDKVLADIEGISNDGGDW